MSISELKKRAYAAIDARASELREYVEDIARHAELGFFETRTAAKTADLLRSLDLPVKEGLALTGVRADIDTGREGPTVAVLGELDSVVCIEAPLAVKETGAAHQCGHNIQLGAMAGAAIGIKAVSNELYGKISFMGVPAEEYIEIGRRLALKADGKIHYIGGKAELVRIGEFDDVDISMMIHAMNGPGARVTFSNGTNGFLGLTIRYVGKQAHAAAGPHEGINALNAAMIGISAVHALRETFRDEDNVRVHFIITKGGDLVNCVPDDVRLEAYVRANSVPVIEDTARRVIRAFRAGGDAVGAETEVKVLPGMYPFNPCKELETLFVENSSDFVPADGFSSLGNMSGSTDMGDISQIMPALHPWTGGVSGVLHGKDFKMMDFDAAVLVPAKAMAGTVIDLLGETGGKRAREICEGYKPNMTKKEYLAALESYFSYK